MFWVKLKWWVDGIKFVIIYYFDNNERKHIYGYISMLREWINITYYFIYSFVVYMLLHLITKTSEEQEVSC